MREYERTGLILRCYSDRDVCWVLNQIRDGTRVSAWRISCQCRVEKQPHTGIFPGITGNSSEDLFWEFIGEVSSLFVSLLSMSIRAGNNRERREAVSSMLSSPWFTLFYRRVEEHTAWVMKRFRSPADPMEMRVSTRVKKDRLEVLGLVACRVVFCMV